MTALNTEHELRLTTTIHGTLAAMRASLHEGTLGKHLPRMFAPRRLVSEAGPSCTNIITLAGVKDGNALLEIRSAPDALGPLIGSAPGSLTRLRHSIGISRVDEPWLRALVPLTGTLAGARVQLRQPHAFNPTDIGFIVNNGGERRGVGSRHFTGWSVNRGTSRYYLPAIRATTALGQNEAYFAVPLDSYISVRMETLDGFNSPVPVVHGPLLKGSERLAANRIIRKQMRNSADDIAARISAALAVLDLPDSVDGSLPVAIALQDMLGLTNHHPDFVFKTECESALGRDLNPWTDTSDQFVAAVVAGTVHTGTRTPLSDDQEANLFIRALRSFKDALHEHQDKVFQASTIFSSAPELSPTAPDYAQLSVLPNLTII